MTINLDDDWKQLTQEILNIPGSSDSSLESASVDVSIKDYLQGLENLFKTVSNNGKLRNQINEFKYYIYETYYKIIKRLLSIHNRGSQREDSDNITYNDVRHISALFTLYVYIFFYNQI